MNFCSDFRKYICMRILKNQDYKNNAGIIVCSDSSLGYCYALERDKLTFAFSVSIADYF